MGDVPRRTWGPKYALTESVNRLTHPVKTVGNAHNTRFLQLARSDRAGRSVALGPEIRGRTALALRLSLRHNPLVNKRADRPGRIRIMASLKMLSHFEKARLLVISHA